MRVVALPNKILPWSFITMPTLIIMPILPALVEIMDFIGHQIKDNAIKIADFWEKKGIKNPTTDRHEKKKDHSTTVRETSTNYKSQNNVIYVTKYYDKFNNNCYNDIAS